jgi:hypothetical protein
MSFRCFGVGSQQTSQLSRVVDEQRIELEILQREKKDEAAESAKQISGIRLRVVELETQLGKGQATKETFSEARHGSASGGAPFNFCSSPGIYFSLASLCEAKDLAIGTKAVRLVANHADIFALQELNRHHSTRYHRILQRIAQQESHLGGDLETT